MTKMLVALAVCVAACSSSSTAGSDAGHGADGGVHASHWPEIVTTDVPTRIVVTPSPSCVPLSRGTWRMTGSCGATTCTMSGDSATPCSGTLTCGSDAWDAITSGDVLAMSIGGGSCSGLTRATLISGTCAVGGATCSFDASFEGP